MDEDPARAAPAPAAVPLERMGIEELQSHIRALQAEITRAEAEVQRKQGLRNAADSVFRKP